MLKVSSLKISKFSSYLQIKLFVYKLIWTTLLFTFTKKKHPSEILVEQRAKSNNQRAKSNEQPAKSKKQRGKTNEQRAKTNEQRAKTNEQRAKSERFHLPCS